jgi:uncharacterized membrane protein
VFAEVLLVDCEKMAAGKCQEQMCYRIAWRSATIVVVVVAVVVVEPCTAVTISTTSPRVQLATVLAVNRFWCDSLFGTAAHEKMAAGKCQEQMCYRIAWRSATIVVVVVAVVIVEPCTAVTAGVHLECLMYSI